MKRRGRLLPFGAILFLAASCAALIGHSPSPQAQVNGVKQTFTATTTGFGPIIPALGYSSCSIQLDNIGSGMTLKALATSDANPSQSSQWGAATGLGTAGTITTSGIFVGNIAGQGLTAFTFQITALSSGTVSGSISCSTATAPGAVVIPSFPPVVFPSPGPTGTYGAPYVIPTAQPVCSNTAIPCTQVSGYVAPLTGPTDSGSRQIVNDNGQTSTILTSGSATSCTNIKNAATTLFSIQNTGALMTVFIQFYNDAATTCAAGTLVWGDGTTLVLGPGQVITMRLPLSAGLAYKISGALTSNLVVVTY